MSRDSQYDHRPYQYIIVPGGFCLTTLFYKEMSAAREDDVARFSAVFWLLGG